MLYTLRNANPEALNAIAEEKRVRKTNEIFLLFSLNSQTDHLIKEHMEKQGVYCLVADPASVTAEDVAKISPKGIILSGGPVSVYEDPPPFDGRIFDLGIPILGICLGFQLWAKHLGIKVRQAEKREFGTHIFKQVSPSHLFFDCPEEMPVLENHGDIVEADEKMSVLGTTDNAPVAAGNHRHLWGVQFHPEVPETQYGEQIFSNFCFRICGAKDKYPAEEVAGRKIKELREQIGDKKVLLALSGGSDSSTVGYLIKHALAGKKEQFCAVYIKAVDRPDDEAFVRKYFSGQDWVHLEVVDATVEFLEALKGKVAMHEKRVAMRSVYKGILEKVAKRLGADYIAQGTLYTDISESGGGYASGARKAQIKLHHNVALGFSLPELTPLDDCVKDSGRNIGRSIGVPEELLTRHPFPGPGMVVRIEGAVNVSNLVMAREADRIFISALREWKLYDSVWQAGAIVTRSVTTCTKGDDAVSGAVVALMAVWSVNGFTARAAELPYDFLKYVSRKITNEIREVGAVVYRISDKPPATIEWG